MRRIIITVTVLVVVLALSLVSDAKTASFDQRVSSALQNGGTVRTQTYSQWQLHRYKETTLPKKYPFKYAPWVSYVNIDRYVTVSADSTHNTLIIDEALYGRVKTEADENRKTAEHILRDRNVRGTGTAAYRKIRKYVRAGKYKQGIKSASGFFSEHQGDCAAHAAAMYVLCKVQGIPVRYCIGGLSGSLHAWNRVKLGGRWYWTDETMERGPSRKLWDGYRYPMQMW